MKPLALAAGLAATLVAAAGSASAEEPKPKASLFEAPPPPPVDERLVGSHTIWTKTRLGLFKEDQALEAVEERHLEIEEEKRLARLREREKGKDKDTARRVDKLVRDHATGLGLAGAPRSRNPEARLVYAWLLADTDRELERIAVLESIVKGRPGDFVRAETWAELALAYGHRGNREAEIEAYTLSLSVLPPSLGRSVVLANRAESYMASGQLQLALDGYRDALAPLQQPEMAAIGVTTLWGLAVALDRSGDPELALTHVTFARSYDPIDSRLRSESWSFSPRYDEYWYTALGFLLIAKATEGPTLRFDALVGAQEQYKAYFDAAPLRDPYRALAAARADRLDKEILQAKRAMLKERGELDPPTPLPKARSRPAGRR